MSVAERMSAATTELKLGTSTRRFQAFGASISFVYRPLEYAAAVAERYVARFGATRKEVLFVGMNPGPFGMGQTGVPFGEVSFVRDWMKLDGTILVPRRQHAKRPIQGFACTRSEVSGRRLWSAFAARFPVADDFFARAFVVNYCPLLFLAESGANVTPDKLGADVRTRLEAVCDAHLRTVVATLAPRWIVGVGGYATKRVARVAPAGITITTMPHPSPASPAANRGWEVAATEALRAAGIRGLL
jgi:single-strand selective monofunctional uracil DNA glycosylase